MRHVAAISGASLALLALCACGESAQGIAPPPPEADAGSAAADASVIRDAGSSPIPDAAVSHDSGAGLVDECDPVRQTGCAPPADKCVVEGPGSGTACVEPTTSDLPLGAPCQGRDCASGLACARLSTTSSTSVCVKVCDLGSGEGCEALGPEFECRTRLTGTNWGACGALPLECNPYTQDPCAQDQACQPFLLRTGTWEFRCRTAGPGVEGDVCGPGQDACARGLACVSSRTGAAFCRQICELNEDCQSPSQCNGVVNMPQFTYCSE